MCAPGGEVAFISKLIDESINLQGRVRWYSSMLGKLSSVSTLLGKLKDHDIENYALTEFTQGNTKRWGLAWSFLPMRPREVLPHASKLIRTSPVPWRYRYDLTFRRIQSMSSQHRYRLPSLFPSSSDSSHHFTSQHTHGKVI
jgi:23S rRNA (adenine1618-N6)-methyltransferase